MSASHNQPRKRIRPFGIVLALLSVIALLFGGTQIASATGTVGPNQPAYWQSLPGELCYKVDNVNTMTFTVPTAPEGRVWSKAIVKAGSEESTDNPNQVVTPIVAGQVLSHSSGKTISHVILCSVPPALSEEIPVPAKPDVTDPCGPNNASWTVPQDTDKVDWTFRSDGHLIAATKAGYIFKDGTTSHDYGVAKDSGVLCEQPPSKVTPAPATSVDLCGTARDTYTVPSKDGVVYKVNGVIKTALTYPGVDTVVVTAHPANSTIVLEGQTSWTFHFTNVPCQPDQVIAPRASLSSECEIVDSAKTGYTVVNAALGNGGSGEEVFEFVETIDGVTKFFYVTLAAGEEIAPQLFYSAADGRMVSLVINVHDFDKASLSFNTASCAATVTPPPPTKVCPKGTKWMDINGNGKVNKGECKTPVTHKPPTTPPVPPVMPPNNSVPPADTGWETHQDQGGSTSPWLIAFTLLGGAALLTAAASKVRRKGAHRR